MSSDAVHKVHSCFLPDDLPPEHKLVVIILNWQLPREFLRFWLKAHLRICADGGANRLYDESSILLADCTSEFVQKQRELFSPDVIAGDMDSIRPEVRAFYEQLGRTKILDFFADQDSTDLQKCLECATDHIQHNQADFPQPGNTTILVLGGPTFSGASIPNSALGCIQGAFGGRLDHTLGNLGVLFAPDVTAALPKPAELMPQATTGSNQRPQLVLMGEEGSLARSIPKGRSEILPCRTHEGPACGLLTITGPATCTFTGLRWNLDNARMEMGGLLSTCNMIEEDKITIETDAPLLWTTQLVR